MPAAAQARQSRIATGFVPPCMPVERRTATLLHQSRTDSLYTCGFNSQLGVSLGVLRLQTLCSANACDSVCLYVHDNFDQRTTCTRTTVQALTSSSIRRSECSNKTCMEHTAWHAVSAVELGAHSQSQNHTLTQCRPFLDAATLKVPWQDQ